MAGHLFDGLTDSVPVIDIGGALDLLASAVEDRGDDFVFQQIWMGESRNLTSRGASDDIVGQALAFADVRAHELEAMPHVGVRDLYLRGELPVTLTMGALAVFHAAQQSQDRGCRWGDVLEHATAAAVRFLDLLPGAALDVAANSGVSTTAS
jgi:hypothetical protein